MKNRKADPSDNFNMLHYLQLVALGRNRFFDKFLDL